jgi:hypothetical protein
MCQNSLKRRERGNEGWTVEAGLRSFQGFWNISGVSVEPCLVLTMRWASGFDSEIVF